MRPKISTNIRYKDFINYYWLKEELHTFCRILMIPQTGNKEVLTRRIYTFLKDGVVESYTPKNNNKSNQNTILSMNSIIGLQYKNNSKTREFFRLHIGDHFKFNIEFMNWIKENPDKKYIDAIIFWNKIYDDRKKGKKSYIQPQFEYNRYVREIYLHNKHISRADVIRCWKYKKSLPGHNRYEESDLIVLDE